ncbi:MAG: segregation/condensation protein A [Candidatus Marinimicrobia bacterium]|nr:segregation/condensation protein A [Candidatus Neomarinimicrobiota bacterium]
MKQQNEKQKKQFEGPLDLLVNLLEKKKMSINEVSLAQITDQYLSYLKKLKNFPAKEVSYFLVVASTLVLIKSRSLMPSLRISQEEEVEIEDLEKRLRLYQKIKKISNGLENAFGKKIIFSRKSFLQTPHKYKEKKIFVAPRDLSVFNIHKALSDLLNVYSFQQNVLPEKIVGKTITLEQKINELSSRLQNKISLCFSEINNNKKPCKIDVIISFLAILELTKREAIRTNQDQSFGEITITKYTEYSKCNS